jgi:hypothetical protein
VENVINNPTVILPRPKHFGGAPPFYKSPEDMQRVIDDYFDTETHPEVTKDGLVDVPGPYTITGLAYHLGFTSRQALLNYQGKEQFVDTVTRAKLRIEKYAHGSLYDKNKQLGAKFDLEHNFADWKPQQNAIPASTLTADDALRLISGMVDLLGKMQRPMRNVTPDTPAIDASIDDVPYAPHG